MMQQQRKRISLGEDLNTFLVNCLQVNLTSLAIFCLEARYVIWQCQGCRMRVKHSNELIAGNNNAISVRKRRAPQLRGLFWLGAPRMEITVCRIRGSLSERLFTTLICK